jgi:hypothetical protein
MPKFVMPKKSLFKNPKKSVEKKTENYYGDCEMCDGCESPWGCDDCQKKEKQDVETTRDQMSFCFCGSLILDESRLYCSFKCQEASQKEAEENYKGSRVYNKFMWKQGPRDIDYRSKYPWIKR